MKKLFALLIPVMVVFHSCDIDMKDTKVPVNTTLPLTDFNITETTLLSWAGLKDEVQPGPNGVLEINKAMEMTIGTPQELHSIFILPDQNFSIPANLYGSVPSAVEIAIDPPLKFEESFRLPGDYSIQSAILNSGTLRFGISNSISDFSNVLCTIEELTRDGVPFTIRPGQTKSLEGYKLAFRDDRAKITFTLSGNISAKAQDNLSNIQLNIDFHNLEIREAEGFFGRNVIAPDRDFTIRIDPGVTDFFENCDYYLSNPQVRLKLNNTYDLPILVQISKLEIGGKPVPLKNEPGGNKIVVKPRAVTEYLLSNASTLSGSGLSDAISADLSSVTVAFTVITNPTREDTGDNTYVPPVHNKISISDQIVVQEYFIIPFDGWFTDIPFNQEFDMDISDNKNTVYEYFKLAVVCTNEMPLELSLTLVAVDGDDAGQILFEEPIVIPASNGLNPRSDEFRAGVISESNAAIRTIPGEKVRSLLEAKKLRFALKGAMPQSGSGKNMKFYTQSSLQLKLIGNLKGGF